MAALLIAVLAKHCLNGQVQCMELMKQFLKSRLSVHLRRTSMACAI